MFTGKNASRRAIYGALSTAIVAVLAQQGWSDSRVSIGGFKAVQGTQIDFDWSRNVLNGGSITPADDVGSAGPRRGGAGDVVKNWNNPAGGPWSTATNWTPNGVPVAGDDAIFNLASTYTVTNPSGSLSTLQVNNGNVSLTGGSLSLTSTNSPGAPDAAVNTATALTVGLTPGVTSRLNISGGATIEYTQAYASLNAGSIATLDISGAGTLLRTNAATNDANGRFGVIAGNGTINIRDGAEVRARLFEFGRQNGTAANRNTVNVNITNGGKLSMTSGGAAGQIVLSRGTFTDATMLVDGAGSTVTAANIFIGSVNGTGAVTVSNGGQVTSQQLSFEGNSSLTVSGANSVYNSVNTFIADNGAVSTLNVNNGGTFVGAQGTFTNDNASGTINVASGGKVTYDTFFSGSETTTNSIANVNLTGAGSNLRINNVVVTNGGSGTTGLGTTTFSVQNGSTLSVGRINFNQQSGTAGDPASAKTIVNVSGAGSVFEVKDSTGGTTSYASLGFGANSTSEINVTNNGAFNIVDTTPDTNNNSIGQLIVGSDVNTINNINVNTGGDVNVQSSSFFGTVSTAVANVTVAGAGSTFDSGGLASFGGGGVADTDFNAGGGTTNLTVSGGGVFRGDSVALARDPATSLANGAKTNITVSGAGSTFIADGLDDAGTPAIDDGYFTTSFTALDEFGFEIPGSGDGLFATINLNVQSGGLLKANEAIFLGDTQDGSTTLTVSGTGSVVDSGRQLSVNASGLANSNVTINLNNGGVLKTTASAGNASITAGSMFIGDEPSLGATINVNLTGTGSTLQSSGSIFLGGGEDEFGFPTAGSPVTVTAGAGTNIVAAGSLFLGSTSTITSGGNVSIAGVSTVNGNWTITGGADVFVGTADLVGSGQIKLTNPTASTPTLLKTDNVLIESTARIDVGMNAMRIRPEGTTAADTDLADVKAFLAAGRVGAGDGGITSSALSAGQAVGYRLVTAAGTFLGQPVQAGDILVRATYRGDADLTGNVNFDDLLILAQNYSTTPSGTKEWYQGDFTFDGNVNFDDLLQLAQNYNNALLVNGEVVGSAFITDSFAGDWALALSIVPEPSSLAALGLASAFLGRRRSAR